MGILLCTRPWNGEKKWQSVMLSGEVVKCGEPTSTSTFVVMSDGAPSGTLDL